MLRYSASFAFVLCLGAAACSRSQPADTAKPVASASVTVNPTVVASGMPVELDVRFTVAPAAPPLENDYTVFVQVVHDDGRMIGALDHLRHCEAIAVGTESFRDPAAGLRISADLSELVPA